MRPDASGRVIIEKEALPMTVPLRATPLPACLDGGGAEP